LNFVNATLAEAERLAALPKATVIPLPLDEQIRRSIINGRMGRWEIVPFGFTSYRPDAGPTYAELEMMRARRPEPIDKHEEYSRSLYGDQK
jgi:hypothetical protein